MAVATSTSNGVTGLTIFGDETGPEFVVAGVDVVCEPDIVVLAGGAVGAID